MPTVEHEAAHGDFRDRLVSEVGLMGLRRLLMSIGATTFKTPRVSKEADSALKPRIMRPRGTDWPTIVLQSGWSELLTKFQQDAHIWLENSGGDVNIVLLLSIDRTARGKMIIEKWENRPVPANGPATRSVMRTVPTQIQVITIDSDSNTVHRAPLTLEFPKIFLRQAVLPLEHDFHVYCAKPFGICN